MKKLKGYFTPPYEEAFEKMTEQRLKAFKKILQRRYYVAAEGIKNSEDENQKSFLRKEEHKIFFWLQKTRNRLYNIWYDKRWE